ncbi:MAG: hypothetical protein MUF41_03395 [Sphingopyxis sp.]|nr:hypothetical protein [Sphingopyxis sp.]
MTMARAEHRKPEPPMMERARRVGWALLLLCLALLAVRRWAGAGDWTVWLAGGCGILGVLAVVNVALVRSLYRQLGTAGTDDPAGR